MANFISNLWDDLTGKTAAEDSSAALQAGTDAAMALGEKGLALQEDIFDWTKETWEAQQADIKPYQEAGLEALAKYQAIQADPDALADDPTLQFLQRMGQEQVESSAAARGTQLSGRTLEALSERGQSIASQYRGQVLGELSNLMALGTGTGLQATAGATGAVGAAGAGVSKGYGALADLAQQGGMTQAANIMGAYGGFSNLLSGGMQAAALACSRTFKENYTEINTDDLLAQLNALDIEEWNYIGEDATHVSPYAEDFQKVTGKGDGKTIPVVDVIGLLMGAVQSLSAKVNELEAK